MKDTCDFNAFTGHRIHDNLIHIEFKKIKKLTSLDVSQVYECFEKFGSEHGVYVMATFKGYIPLSDEAMAEAKKKKNEKYVKATAFVIRTIAFRVGIKFFINFFKPKHKINILGTKVDAIAWLKKEREMQG